MLRKVYRNDLKSQIVKMHQKGEARSVFTKLFDIRKSVVSLIIKRYTERGTTVRPVRSGRPPSTTRREDILITRPNDIPKEVQQLDQGKQYLEKEGIQLNPDKIEKNPGLRQVGKAVITSFWGKLGQRENQAKTTIVNEPTQFYGLMTKPGINAHTVQIINDSTLVVNWEHKEKLGERVLYYDTDSVIYISRPGEWEVPLGNFLGEMTDELECYGEGKWEVPLGNFLGEMTDELECYGEGSYITTFASGGPKLYNYRVYSPAEDKYYDTVKVKGITINHNTSKIVNFQSLCDMVLKKGDEPKYITTKNIRRTIDHNVVTRAVTKTFRPTFSKRRRLENYGSVPYGHKRVKQV
ncbi:hypothetical protein QE152_g37525 [Popillia japonica]|uniref:DNA-directed DNA polymerase n=1 Tax=Popillia japonica TaxID=7064 RepID=A0AAW1IAB0_POPJA